MPDLHGPGVTGLAGLLALAALLAAGCSDAPVEDAPGAPALAILVEREGTLPSPEGLAWEPSVAINPLDASNAIVVVSDGYAGLSIYSTFDRGAAWSRTTLPVGMDAPLGSPEWNWTFMGDPVGWFGPDGTAYAGGLARTIVGNGNAGSRHGADIFLAKSTDGGRSFGPAIVAAKGMGTVVGASAPMAGEVASVGVLLHNLDKPWFAAGPDGRLLAVWNDLGADGVYPQLLGEAPIPYAGNEMYASWSDDGGATWSPPSRVVESSPRSPYPFFGADGSMHIAFLRWDDGLARVASWNGNGWDAVEVDAANGQPIVAVLPDGTQRLAVADPDGAPSLSVGRDGAWTRLMPLAGAIEGDPRANVAFGAGAVWTSWYGGVGQRSYHVRADLPGGQALNRTLDEGLGGLEANYGHYSNGLAAGPEGALVAWPAILDERREFRFAWVRIGEPA